MKTLTIFERTVLFAAKLVITIMMIAPFVIALALPRV